MNRLEKWLRDLKKRGFEYITIEQILLQIAQIERENILRREK